MRLWLLLIAGARAAVNTKKHLDWLTHQRKHALPHRINSRHERWAKAHIKDVDAAPPLKPGERLDAEHPIPCTTSSSTGTTRGTRTRCRR